MSTDRVFVWDLWVRVSHWLLVCTFTVSYLSATRGYDEIHVISGYTMAVVIIFRLVWGFVGSPCARFSHFFYGIKDIWLHVNQIIRNKPDHYIGHSPAGSVYVYLALLLLSLIVSSGLLMQGYFEYEGPLWLLHIEPTHGLARFSETIHERIPDLMLVLIVMHLAGVFLASWQHRERLVKAMFTGYKSHF